mgnify:CR=1 FL=1
MGESPAKRKYVRKKSIGKGLGLNRGGCLQEENGSKSREEMKGVRWTMRERRKGKKIEGSGSEDTGDEDLVEKEREMVRR